MFRVKVTISGDCVVTSVDVAQGDEVELKIYLYDLFEDEPWVCISCDSLMVYRRALNELLVKGYFDFDVSCYSAHETIGDID